MDRLDRGKIAEIIYYWFDDHNGYYGYKWKDIPNDWRGKIDAYKKADQILALFLDIEAMEEHTSHLVDDVIALEAKLKETQCVDLENCCDLVSKLEEAKREERERIMGVIENINSIGHPYGGDYKCAIQQALKGKE